MAKRVFVTAAEVSGDKHAGHLIQSLRRLDPSLIIEGLGGPAMAAAGAHLHRETVGKAAMGWRGALRAVEVYGILRWTRKYFREHPPDLQICVDSPAMNFHFARAARAANIPVLYYVAPQLWGWREGRMKKLRASVDRLACILPFEEAYFRGHGVNATFVGHPLFDQLPRDRRPSDAPRDAAHAPVVGLLPGSRKSEAEHNFSHLLEVARRIRAELPAVSFLVPTTSATDPVVRRLLAEQPSARAMEVGLNAFDQFVPRCDLCLTVSGTATLHVAAFGVPMIVVYRMSPLLWHGLGRWLVNTGTFALVNVLASGVTPSRSLGTAHHIVPEVIPWYGSDEPLAKLALQQLRDPAKLAEQRARLAELVASLDRPGASDRVAGMALELMSERRPSAASTPTASVSA